VKEDGGDVRALGELLDEGVVGCFAGCFGHGCGGWCWRRTGQLVVGVLRCVEGSLDGGWRRGCKRLVLDLFHRMMSHRRPSR
jgi:hypothetical protein